MLEGAQALAQLHAVHAGQMHIEEEQVGGLFAQVFPGFLRRREPGDGQAVGGGL